MKKIKSKIEWLTIAMWSSFLLVIVASLLEPVSYRLWFVTEYLINYSAGFVRRGLPGEILYMLNDSFGVNVWWCIHIFAIIVFILFCVFLLRETIRLKHSVLFLPTGIFLGFAMASSHNVWNRKDFFVMLLVLGFVKLLASKSPTWLKFLFCNLMLIVGVLSHEIIFFLVLPCTLVMLAKPVGLSLRNIMLTIAKTVLFLFPSVFAFLASCCFKGNAETANAIWNSWGHIVEGDVCGAIKGIGWSFAYALDATLVVWRTVRLGVVWYPLLWTVLFLFVALVYVRMDRYKVELFGYRSSADYNDTSSLTILLFQILALLPVSLVFCDTGRLIFFILISSFIVRLYCADKYAVVFSSSGIYNGMNKLASWSNRKISISDRTLFIIAIILGLPTINVSALEHTVLHGSVVLFFKSIIDLISSIF